MNVRKPAVAGQFYGGTKAECLSEIEECLPKSIKAQIPANIVGAIVPHAGWMFSGHLACSAFKAISQANEEVDTFILFGAAHRYLNGRPAVYDSGQWETPIGRIAINGELAKAIVGLGADSNTSAHRDEHSIEVQVPFIQYLFPNAQIVPVIVPTADFESSFGTRVGELIKKESKKVVCIGSTDLTHYGPRYGFCPHSAGPAGIQWAKDVNDVEFINLVLTMDADNAFETAMEKGSACGPAAAATVIAAAKAQGRTRGVLLGHTTSSDIIYEKFNQPSEESVGYAAVVF